MSRPKTNKSALDLQTLKSLTTIQKTIKRTVDVTASFLGLVMLSPIIFLGWCAATFSTRANGLFIQQRVGMEGRLFPLFKLRSMRTIENMDSSVTASNDLRITRTGRVLRKLKIDELPQLLNVLLGHMSLVGPRPDVPGFADELAGDARVILTIRPGITGPASIAFRNEEELLSEVVDPEKHNREVIWPEKIRLNMNYIRDYSLSGDIKYIWQTITGGQS